MYSDQPTIPSSVVTLRNELTRHPASQCRSSTLTIFIAVLLLNELRSIDGPPLAVGIATGGAVHRPGTPSYFPRRFVFSTRPARRVGPSPARRISDRRV